MTDYDPFVRENFPVGVRSFEFNDSSRDRKIPVEFWHPALEKYCGQDLDRGTQDRYRIMPNFPRMRQSAMRDADAEPGRYPLVIFSHGLAGHRRQTTHFCTHLASHGYIVAAPDHLGSTMPDIIGLALSLRKKDGSAQEVVKTPLQSAKDRPVDVSFTIDAILAEELGQFVDPEKIGIAGHSFGGWTSLAALKH